MAANLTDVAIKTRKGVRFGIYGLFAIMILQVLWGFARKNIIPILFPPPLPPATVGFDRLPAIPFPAPAEPIPELSFLIETSTGTLPVFPENLEVYFMPKSAVTLDSVATAKRKAHALGFDTTPVEVSQAIYRFSHPNTPATLEMNIITGTFSTSFNLAADPSPLNFPAPSLERAKGIATAALERAESAAEDLTIFAQPDYLKVESQNLVKALSQSEADLTRVNIYRQNVGPEGQYKSMTKSADEANVWFIISGSNETNTQIIASEYFYYPIDVQSSETYPIKTASTALEELKAGKGYIANLGLNKDGQITIRNIYLAYYDPDTQAQFYQPIIVFEGDQGFLAYIPAVTDDYYGKAENDSDGS